ncbi:MAG: DUF222 domain-containing protein [Specibacter sp.]
MSNRVDDPGSRGGNTTADVVALISAITFPSIERFTPDSPLLAGLPPYTPCPVPAPEPLSRVAVARSVYDGAVAALAALKRFEDATAACKAALVDRLMGAALVEGTALSLDGWQSGVAEQSAQAEIATVLRIPEGTAATLVRHSRELLESHPATLDALAHGVLSWRHAGTIVDESSTLAQMPGMTADDLLTFEQRLLKAAPRTTASGFKSKARRLREGMHPESLPIRTREAFLKRDIRMEPGQDGMSWLTLHLPAPAAEGIWVHCTRQARKLQGPSENRTLMQLRIDIAAALLLGQHPLDGAGQGADGGTGTARDSSTGSGTPSGSSSGGGAGDDSRFGKTGTHAEAAGIPTGPHSGTPTTGGAACGDESGYVDGLVDGLPERPLQDYLEQLAAVREGLVIADPPLPQAQILVTVPALGLLGITNEPADLVGYGPIPESIARKLLANAETFLRVLTDPVTGEPLDANPDRYWIRESERAVLRAKAGTCYFPNCTNPVLDTETDHLTAWAQGGKSSAENERPACKRHHILKHFKDDKDRHGRYRVDRDPDRAGIRLRGWKPIPTSDGRVGWSSPSGKYHPPIPRETAPPRYPKWIRQRIDKAINTAAGTQGRPQGGTLGGTLGSTQGSTQGTAPGRGVVEAITPPSFFEHLLIEYQPPQRA